MPDATLAPEEETVTRRKKPRHRAVPLMPEVRFRRIEGLEVRSSTDTDEIILSGAAIVFDEPYEVRDLFGPFEERMSPGVAADVLANGADVRYLFNHDGMPLARTLAGTLKVSESGGSLDFEARLDARQQLANDLWIAVERGDVSQNSVGFIVGRDEWDENEEKRTIHAFSDLLDISSVTYPASPTTHVQVAQRMALAMPVESRARLRNMIVSDRAGAVLSGANLGRVGDAIGALHELYSAGGGNPADLIPDTDIEPDGESEMLAEVTGRTARTLRLQIEARRLRREA